MFVFAILIIRYFQKKKATARLGRDLMKQELKSDLKTEIK